VTTLNIGDIAHVKTPKNTKQIRVTGYWRFKPFSPIEDEFIRNTLQTLINEDLAKGLCIKEERIEPCEQCQAQLVGTSDGFCDVKDVELITLAGPIDAVFHKEEHAHKLSVMKEYGETGLYGRIKLPITEFPRFFDKSGVLLPEFNV
jgi:hypothetical protein